MKAATTNRRTTFWGALAALATVAPLVVQYLQVHRLPDTAPVWSRFAEALFLAALGFVAKDANVTGLPSNARTE